MSEFQRFITYINLYEENNKIRSVGFAKIERQQEQCKMEIHMKSTGYTGISCPVYLFVREKDKMAGVQVGKLQMSGGMGDGRFQLDADNIGGSGYSMDQVGGFLIFVSGQIMFASLWDDKELRREQFVPVQEWKKALAAERKPQRQEEALAAEQKSQRQKEASAAERKPQRQEEALAAEQKPQRQEEASGRSSGQAADRPAPGKTIKAAEAAAQPQVFVRQEEAWGQKWKYILENYPVLTPFEGEEEILCVRLELKDLRLLPKCYWYLGNNSFLLHGFFNYRYLILGAMTKGDKKRWFLGIPGVFQSQEKVMAAIFGFPEYKSEKTAGQKTDQFGYWYRFLE